MMNACKLKLSATTTSNHDVKNADATRKEDQYEGGYESLCLPSPKNGTPQATVTPNEL